MSTRSIWPRFSIDAARLPAQVELDLWNTCHELEALLAKLDDVQSELEAFRNRRSRHSGRSTSRLSQTVSGCSIGPGSTSPEEWWLISEGPS